MDLINQYLKEREVKQAMAWVKKSQGGNFLRFVDGGVHEGVFQGATEKPSPFKPGEMIWDYRFQMDGIEKTLSSTSTTLKEVLTVAPVGATVRIEMRVSKGRKLYDVYLDE